MFSKIISLLLLTTLCLGQIYPQFQIPVIQPPQFSFCNSNSECCDENTITVQGDTTLQVDPDQALLSASISASSKTVEGAVTALAQLVNRIINILNNNGLNQDNYQTTNFNVYPNSSWNNGVQTILGQIATQSFFIVVPFTNSNSSNIGKLIDDLASVNGITLNGLTFDLKSKTVVYQQARELAFKSAKTKANDYAEALSLKLQKVLNIKDSFNSAPVVQQIKSNDMKLALADSTPTTVNVGTIPISCNCEVVFGFS